MAYRDDIAALNPSHAFYFDGNANDSIGSANGTNSGGVFTGSAITEDATNCWTSNGTADRITLPATTTINNSAQTRKAVAGWFEVTSVQTPPKRIYGEGTNATCFQFMMAYGNNVMFECVEPTNFTLQVFGPPLQPNRVYHLCGIFEGNGFGNEVRFYVDGVEQTLAEPTNRQPATADLNSRGVGEFGDPAGTVGVGGDVVLLNSPVNGNYQHWYFWDGADAVLTDTEVREELFEKGCLPAVTISSDTQANMQTALDALADTVRPDEPLNIRVEALSGGGDLTLTADNITHNALASIHVQYMGTDTLTWVKENGSDASIGSTPNGGTITFVESVNLTVTVLDASDFSPIQNARVLMEADTGGPLASGTDILTGLTNASGQLTGTLQYSSDQPVTGRVRKGSSAPLYKTGPIGGTITSSGLSTTVLLVGDE